MNRVSMLNIANKVGVSKGTVSLVLSGKAKNKRVSEELSRKIIETAREMNYQPNELARGLRTGYTKTIGVVLADVSNEFFGLLAFHIQRKSKELGYMVMITNTDESIDELTDAIMMLANRRIDGIIMVPTDGSEDNIEKILEQKIPLVLVDRYFEKMNVSYVVLDNYKASADMTKKLIASGCKKIAMVRHKNNLSVAMERTNGYIDALTAEGLYDEKLIKDIRYTNEEHDMKNAITELYKDIDGVNAIFFQSHRLFLTGVKTMLELGVKIPKDMQVGCFDKIDAFAMSHFPIAYIEQPIKDMAEKAVDILIKQIENGSDIQQCKYMANIKSI